MDIKRRIFVFSFLLLTALFAQAQKRISADVQIKQMRNHKVVTVEKTIYYQRDGKFVTHFTKPEEYISITNTLGETKVYTPRANEVMTINDKMYSSKNELLHTFLSNSYSDLGLGEFGFKVISQKKVGNKVVKTYRTSDARFEDISKVEIAFENQMPVYCAFFNAKQQATRKVYYSAYEHFGTFSLPLRITEIDYQSAKDSVLSRQIYSNIQIDRFRGKTYFDYKIPSSAKKVNPFKK